METFTLSLRGKPGGRPDVIAPHLRPTLALGCAALLAAGTSACSRAAPARSPVVAEKPAFRGVYEMGSDRSAFLPCASGEQWYVSPQSAAARELRRLTNTQDLQSPGGGMVPATPSTYIRRAYAEVEGDTVPVTSGQAALAHQRELRLTRVVVVRPAQGGACP